MSIDPSDWASNCGPRSDYSDGASMPDVEDLHLQQEGPALKSAESQQESLDDEVFWDTSRDDWESSSASSDVVSIENPSSVLKTSSASKPKLFAIFGNPQTAGKAPGLKRKQSGTSSPSSQSGALVIKSLGSSVKKLATSIKSQIRKPSSSGPVGISKSSKRTADVKAKLEAGNWVDEPLKLERWLEKLRNPEVVPWPGDPPGKAARHTDCGKRVAMAVV